MPSPKQQTGNRGELMAQQYLEKQGFRCLEKQWRTRYGEIDLIMMDRDELVFVEVKLRSTDLFGHPEEMISWRKARRLTKTALTYFSRYGNDRLFWRFDTVAITGKGDGYEIAHFKDTIRDDRL